MKSQSLMKVIFFFCAFQFVVIVCLSIGLSNIDPALTEIDWISDLNLFDIFLLSVVIGPFVETCVFQFFIVESVFLFVENNSRAKKVACILSSMLFGLSHYYNFYYVLVMVLVGLFYCWVYIFIKNWKSRKSAFWSLTLIHLINNAFAFIVNDVLKID